MTKKNINELINYYSKREIKKLEKICMKKKRSKSIFKELQKKSNLKNEERNGKKYKKT